MQLTVIMTVLPYSACGTSQPFLPQQINPRPKADRVRGVGTWRHRSQATVLLHRDLRHRQARKLFGTLFDPILLFLCSPI
jgi:hypothetical protein